MLALLSQLLHECGENALWIADENSKALLVDNAASSSQPFPGRLISNRWDIVQAAASIGIRASFSDFNLESAAESAALEVEVEGEGEGRFSRILYPVSKEKAAVHHIINCAPDFLQPGGELLLIGSKNSGIKTYAQKAAQRFGASKQLQKHGSDYLSISKVQPQTGQRLDDSDYPLLRPLDSLGGLYSKPGLFGWNKIDTGSALLATHFAEHHPSANARVVDLGCGYGYLSTQLAQQLPTAQAITIQATDNNAAAIQACQRNFQVLGIQGEVVAGDAGSTIESRSADLLICNPPFHQGFQVEGDLTDRFLKQAARILRPQGIALFVVNEFIPLGKKAQGIFQSAELLNKEKGFCVYRLTKS
ncbi:class I SAM-dependent methyltransferase [Microbulbifer sp. CAU 1566]|uniref:class I SAM-dependent methyltransferase n=1 Tax=Microbulbifer sp. CAU 1566 TaxID=2933269 RepID=UPI0020045584|nr:methyltransferase [Microbulbifer sp. CAU 1566]MCK7597374.1 class I SAM-dependent methyltransferase [Microbulbifer sp. CAU 1566]